MQVIVRKFDPITDSGFIYSSYPKGVYHGAYIPINPKDDYKVKSSWFKAFYDKVKHQLAHSTVLIACMSDDPNTILGYAILTGDKLIFTYVKELFRNQGIATLLTHGKYQTIEESNLTKVGKAILEKRKVVTNEDL
jgi:hypothetical protein